MAKKKQTRTYDPDGFRRRAACICVRDPEETEVMLVTSSKAPQYWIVPGGGIEPNEDPNQAAVRETEEEAGVKGVIKRSLGHIEVWEENLERKHRTSVFVLEVKEELDVWEDSRSRKRSWFPVKEALKLLAIYKPIQCTYVKLMIQTSPSLALKSLLTSSSFKPPSSSLEEASSSSLSSSITTRSSTSSSSSKKSPNSQNDSSGLHTNNSTFNAPNLMDNGKTTTTTTTTNPLECDTSTTMSVNNDNNNNDDDNSKTTTTTTTTNKKMVPNS